MLSGIIDSYISDHSIIFNILNINKTSNKSGNIYSRNIIDKNIQYVINNLELNNLKHMDDGLYWFLWPNYIYNNNVK